MYLWVPIETTTGIPEYIFFDELSTVVDSNSTTVENETPKPASNGGSRASSIDSVVFNLSLLEKDAERETETLDPAFRNWLLNKARSLPKEPALLEQWVQKQAQNEANQREFREYQASRARAQVPPPPSPKIFEPETQQQQRLTTLRRMWGESDGGRDRVRQLVTDNPEWQLAIGDRGPEEVQHD